MSNFVLDCSVSISWIFPDEHSNYAEEILRLLENQQAIVPSIWFLGSEFSYRSWQVKISRISQS